MPAPCGSPPGVVGQVAPLGGLVSQPGDDRRGRAATIAGVSRPEPKVWESLPSGLLRRVGRFSREAERLDYGVDLSVETATGDGSLGGRFLAIRSTQRELNLSQQRGLTASAASWVLVAPTGGGLFRAPWDTLKVWGYAAGLHQPTSARTGDCLRAQQRMTRMSGDTRQACISPPALVLVIASELSSV